MHILHLKREEVDSFRHFLLQMSLFSSISGIYALQANRSSTLENLLDEFIGHDAQSGRLLIHRTKTKKCRVVGTDNVYLMLYDHYTLWGI